jgi:hypothetical protein
MEPVMKKILWSLPIMMAIALTSGDAFAFRCGDEMISTGDSRAGVLMKCGKPNHTDKFSAKKSKRGGQGIEKWYYNCGNGDFVYVLTFENGVLKNEETEGRGTGKSNCLGK